MFGSIISGLSNIFGGLLGKSSADANREQIERNNAAVLADKEKDRELQREFAQQGVRWKVEDAKAAGLHPLFALGGSTATYSPSAISLGAAAPDMSMARAVSGMGQDVGRAINATRTQSERVDAFTEASQSLTLQRGALENELLASQIAKLKAAQNPPLPSDPNLVAPSGPVPVAKDYEDRPGLSYSHRWLTNPRWTNAEDSEKRYGEMSDFLMGPAILAADLKYNADPYIMNEVYGRRARVDYRNAVRDRWRGHY